MPENPSSPSRRPVCPACDRPRVTCLCDLVVPVDNPVEVLILQHPAEARQAKGSAQLLHRCLVHSRLWIGDRFDESELGAVMQAGDRVPVLLYPQVAPGAPAPRVPEDLSTGRIRLVVLDATWRKSLRMLHENPVLQGLPRLSLAGVPAPAYGAMRQAPGAGRWSTLEAVAQALDELAGEPGRHAPLRGAMAAFVARWSIQVASRSASSSKPGRSRTGG